MALTNIGDQKTPGRPIEITFAADTGIPSANQEVLLIGHSAPSGMAGSGTVAAYTLTTISNAGDETAGAVEANTKFGAGSEMAKMVIAAIKANRGASTFPVLKAIPLDSAETGFGSALTVAANVKAEFVVSPYDAQDSALRDELKGHCVMVSGAQRVENNQFGTFGVAFNRSEVDPADLDAADSQYLYLCYMRDTGTGPDAPVKSVAEMAAACAAVTASSPVPFNPKDGQVVQDVAAPKKQSDYLSVGAGLESETVLNRGWTPLRVKPNGEVSLVRTVTSRITTNGVVVATSYYDVQDFQVLYFWRKTLFTRFNQPDLTQAKASAGAADLILGEALRLAQLFEDQGMFQAVSQLAKQFKVERSLSDRSRFDVLTPVNVIPGLHTVATNVRATTEFDTISI